VDGNFLEEPSVRPENLPARNSVVELMASMDGPRETSAWFGLKWKKVAVVVDTSAIKIRQARVTDVPVMMGLLVQLGYTPQ
jgi:hypothetical protein